MSIWDRLLHLVGVGHSNVHAPTVTFWDSVQSTHSQSVITKLSSMAKRAGCRNLEPQHTSPKQGKHHLHVVLWDFALLRDVIAKPGGNTARAIHTSHDFAFFLQRGIAAGLPDCGHIILCWIVQQTSRAAIQVTWDEDGKPENHSLDLMASGWERRRSKHSSAQTALLSHQEMSLKIINRLSENGALSNFDRTMFLQLMRYPDSTTHLILTEPFGIMEKWHGEEALFTAMEKVLIDATA